MGQGSEAWGVWRKETEMAKFVQRSKNLKFTLIEMLVVISVLMVLVSLLRPALVSAISFARNTKCMANLKLIGSASIQYSEDYEGSVMPTLIMTNQGQRIWARYLTSDLGYLPVPAKVNVDFDSVAICPTIPNQEAVVDISSGINGRDGYLKNVGWGSEPSAYGMNGVGDTAMAIYGLSGCGWKPLPKVSQIRRPANCILIFDGNYITTINSPFWRIVGRHSNPVTPLHGMLNAVFVDGHVSSLLRDPSNGLKFDDRSVVWRPDL